MVKGAQSRCPHDTDKVGTSVASYSPSQRACNLLKNLALSRPEGAWVIPNEVLGRE